MKQLAPTTIRPWTRVFSPRGQFVHVTHDGQSLLCRTRLSMMIACEPPDEQITCPGCYDAVTFN